MEEPTVCSARILIAASFFRLQLSKSNETQVVLRNIQHSNNGTYRCEVSAEAPYFETDFKEANMSVIGKKKNE